MGRYCLYVSGQSRHLDGTGSILRIVRRVCGWCRRWSVTERTGGEGGRRSPAGCSLCSSWKVGADLWGINCDFFTNLSGL